MASPAHRRRPISGTRALRLVPDPVAADIAAFGAALTEKLNRGGDDEDQLRSPFETLLRQMARHIGVQAILYGEVRLHAIRARPDFAVDVGEARVGYVELKAPGRGVPATWRRPTKREREQWEKLKALPNVLYTDGLKWARYSYGELAGPVVELEGNLSDARKPLRSQGSAFEALVKDFLLWEPEQPRSLAHLINVVAGLCRLLRDEVAVILADPRRDAAHEELSLLAADWRDLLFPELDDIGFADAYAQTVTFALLLARVDGIVFDETSLHEIARLLGKKHSLMGRALAVLTDSEATDELQMIDTLLRVIGCVDWSVIDDGRTDVHADLYERFLSIYDPALRRRSGSYYTPQPLAGAVVDIVDEILRARFERRWGLAADDVMVVDPAMGTGTFLVEVLRSVAATVDARQGIGARAPRLRRFFQERLVGFEIQTAPYAVAELRLHQAMKMQFQTELPPSEVRFLTDALEDPVAQQGRLRAGYRIIEKARREANRIKREVPVMVVIGNPPHVENTKGRAPWIEERRKVPLTRGSRVERPSLDEFRTPGGGRYESDLYGLPWCFWRWAIWKAFEAHPADPQGVVAFVTPASFIKGKSFEGVREYLRRTCDEGWIIELSPEGNRPQQNTRLFGPEVGRQLCIAIFARYGPGDDSTPAMVHRLALTGTSADKIGRLDGLNLEDPGWATCRDGWREPFLERSNSAWALYPNLTDLFPKSSRGVTAGRTWVYAPDPETLQLRWRAFTEGGKPARRQMLPESEYRSIDDVLPPLPGIPSRNTTLADENGPPITPVRVAYRSFDRQWVLPDHRLMVRPRPPLWAVRSSAQIYLTEQSNHPIESGPALVFTHLVPDLHHYNNRSGRVIPLYCDAEGERPNVSPGLLALFNDLLGYRPAPVDVFAYVAGIVGHPGYTFRFKDQLKQPGVRVPLTSDRALWREVVAIGHEILWLHTFGASVFGRPQGVRTFADFVETTGPRVLSAVPDDAGEIPDLMSYDPDNQILAVGSGRIAPVKQRVWDYDVGGMRVVKHWFNYRSASQRYRRRSSPLDDIATDRWTPALTDELLEILAVLNGCVALEDRQNRLLNRVCSGPLVSTDTLVEAGVLPVVGATKLGVGAPGARHTRLF
ncbi:type ISP restriction/modification enzyme [Micromonospora sp. H33]|uniref:type ISP restriction/modification enzyme n=1 Tax=Micromonospora sp. H33 TaxID=3452215 RepID=UPI003F88D4E4